MYRKPSYIAPLLALLLAGCANTADIIANPGYQTARAQSNLEIPPDLVNSSSADLINRTTASTQDVLPALDGVTLRSNGTDRWLEIASSANEVWAQMLDYSTKSGLPILIENKRDGILETDWIGDDSAESALKLKFRARFGDLLGRLPINDRYIFWLEKHSEDSTALHIKHSQLKQYVIEPKNQDDVVKTGWSETPGDGLKALKLLRSMAAFFGGENFETENTAEVVLVETSPPHIVLAETRDMANSRVQSAIASSPYIFAGVDQKRDLLLIKQAKVKGFFGKISFKKRYALELISVSDGKKTRINVVSARGKHVEREDALPILYAITGELRR